MKARHLYLWLVGFGFFFIFIFVVCNSMGCNYELKIEGKGDTYFSVCKYGRVSIVETSSQGDSWLIEGFQASVFNQVFFFVNKRRHMVASQNFNAETNKRNEANVARSVYNYAWRRIDDGRVFFVQEKPSPEVIIGTISGDFDLLDGFN